MFRKVITHIKNFHLTMRSKLVLSLMAIAVILLNSSIISILEYSRMSSYVSDLIAKNINSINVAQKIAATANEYNLKILSAIGEKNEKVIDFNQAEFMAHCDALKADLRLKGMSHLADSVEYAYAAYMLTSMELPSVSVSDFIDTRAWFFDRLQPQYDRLRTYITSLSDAMYAELQKNSATFERGFYRSIIPGAVAVAVGILLVLLLLFFITTYYVTPIYRMLDHLDAYKSVGKPYGYTFDGEDELSRLNEDISEIADDNLQLRKRLKALRSRLNETPKA